MQTAISRCMVRVQVYGIVGNPVAHSRSPLLHNNGFQQVGHDAVYVPLLVDDLPRLLSHPLARDFSGLSVTIPHKVRRVLLPGQLMILQVQFSPPLPLKFAVPVEPVHVECSLCSRPLCRCSSMLGLWKVTDNAAESAGEQSAVESTGCHELQVEKLLARLNSYHTLTPKVAMVETDVL